MLLTTYNVTLKKVFKDGTIQERDVNFIHAVNSLVKYHSDDNVRRMILIFEDISTDSESLCFLAGNLKASLIEQLQEIYYDIDKTI